MTTNSSHKLIMGKVEIDKFFMSELGYFDFFTEMFVDMYSTFHKTFSKSLNLIGCQGDKKG